MEQHFVFKQTHDVLGCITSDIIRSSVCKDMLRVSKLFELARGFTGDFYFVLSHIYAVTVLKQLT